MCIRDSSSIIAEGLDIWDGAGDRGDAAMVAHGLPRYLLARDVYKRQILSRVTKPSIGRVNCNTIKAMDTVLNLLYIGA